MVTSSKKDHRGSRNTPASTVKASPNSGIQESSRDQRPYRPYQPLALSRDEGLTGNQGLSWMRSIKSPTIQLQTAPRTFPKLATATSPRVENSPDRRRPTSSGSDWNGSSVAAPEGDGEQSEVGAQCQHLATSKFKDVISFAGRTTNRPQHTAAATTSSSSSRSCLNFPN